MSIQTQAHTPEQVARGAFAAVAARDPDAIVAFDHEDVVEDFVAVGELRGRAAVRAYFVQLFAAVPDFAMTVEDVIADDRGAAVKWHASGTFTGGPFQGIESTGARLEVRGIDFMEIEDGLIRRNRIAYDGAGFARQVGMLPKLDSQADKAMLAAFNAKTRLARRIKQR